MSEFAFTITREMITGENSLTALKRRRLESAIGPLQPCDENKRVYKVIDICGSWWYQVENNEQRDRRLAKSVQV